MDGDSAVQMKPTPLPRKSNKNVETSEEKSLNERKTGISSSSSDINSNIDNLMERKPNITKFTNTSPSTARSNKPVPLPRKFVIRNGVATSTVNIDSVRSSVLPDLTNVSPTPHSNTGSSVKSGDYEEDENGSNTDDIDYENIPSHPNLLSSSETKDGAKRATINLFNRVVGDPFADFETSIKEMEPLSTITFRSPIEDLDEAARSRISVSSMCSSTTTTSKSSSECSDHYMEPPPPRPVPVDFTSSSGSHRWSNNSSSSSSPYSFNTVPSKPKRSPHIPLPRLSSLEEGQVLNSSNTKPFPKLSTENVSHHTYPHHSPHSSAIESEPCYEPIAPYPYAKNKFYTINSISTKHAINKSSNNFRSVDSNTVSSSSGNIPANNNFSNSKRVTVPNIDKAISDSLTNHHHQSLADGNLLKSKKKNFDATAYDISDIHGYHQSNSELSSSKSSIPSPRSSRQDNFTKRRALSASLSQPTKSSGDAAVDKKEKSSAVIIRRHSSGRSTCSSVGSIGSLKGSQRDSLKKKVHEYDEVAIEDGNVVLLDQSDARSSSTTLNNNSVLSYTSRNSVVQEFDPLFDIRQSQGFPVTGAPLDLNDKQQHRYEYIDEDDEERERSSNPDEAGSSTTNENSPIPQIGVSYHCMDNPGYSPGTPRSSREIRPIDETYEPISSPQDGISPKLSPRPKMGTRVLSKTESPPDLPPQCVNATEDESGLSQRVSSSLQIDPTPTASGNNGSGSKGNFIRKISSKFRLNSIKEEKDAQKSFESLLNAEETYASLTTPCKKCSEPHPESTKCKFMLIYRDNIVYSSHLYKTSGLSKKEFSKKWAVLAKAKLTFYTEKSEVINEISLEKFAVVAKKNDHRVNQNQTDLKCFELALSGGKNSSFTFASGSEQERSTWMQKFIEVHTPSFPSSLLNSFDRAGWCFIKESVTSDWKPCWLVLKDRSLYYSYWKSEEVFPMDLRKARSVVLSQKEGEYKCPFIDNGDVLTIDFVCKKLLYIQTENPKVTSSWEKMIKANSAINGSEFHEMQLTVDDVPVIVEKCIDFVYAHGIRSEGIYRQSGSNTRITQLLQDFKNDAWSVQMSHKEFSAHDVAGTLKRFFRTLPQPLVTVDLYQEWINAANVKSFDEKMQKYTQLLEKLPEINFNIMKKLMGHLYAVHELQEKNLMPLLNLAPIWGPTLMNVDTSNLASSYEIACSECEVVKDLIENYYRLFKIDSQEIEREQRMINALETFYVDAQKRKCSGDMKIWIYVWERDEADNPPINVTLTPTSTAHVIVQQICSKNKIKNIDNLSLHEVIFNEKLERPLHPSEKVIETVLRWSIWDSEERKSNYLILKKNNLYPSLVHYAKEPKTLSGELKFADSKSKSFRKFAFLFSQACLKYYRDSKSSSELGSWKIEEIIWYMGCEPKRNPPTKWTFTFVKRNYPFKRSRDEPYFGNVVTCASEDELYKWIGTMVIGEHPEGLTPIIV